MYQYKRVISTSLNFSSIKSTNEQNQVTGGIWNFENCLVSFWRKNNFKIGQNFKHIQVTTAEGRMEGAYKCNGLFRTSLSKHFALLNIKISFNFVIQSFNQFMMIKPGLPSVKYAAFGTRLERPSY